MLVLITAGICFGVSFSPKTKPTIFAASTKVALRTNGVDEEYSAKFKGDLIFSVEQVLVSSNVENGVPAEISGSDVKTFQGTDLSGNAKKYTFKNIQDEKALQNKTVIDNGQFAVLKNDIKSGRLVAKNRSDEQEALMVSFGAYVYLPDDASTEIDDEDVFIADEEKTRYSKITYLDVTLEKDGIVQELPNNRDINISEEGLFFDFVCVIYQDVDNKNEGYYKFTLNYMIGKTEYEETFEFFVINEISYSQITGPSEFGYNAQPTLGWTEGTISNSEFAKTKKEEGYVRYNIGSNGYSDGTNFAYPTITYDYTKYKLNFTHTQQRKNVSYSFEVQFNKTLNNQSAQMNYSISSSGQSSSGSFQLKDYDEQSTINLVTIVLTEPGTYSINYDLIYDGYNASSAPNIGIEPVELKLSIHGHSTEYSKADYESARMQYFEILTTIGNHVDLFVPNGFNVNSSIENLQNQELGFAYKLIEEEFDETKAETAREGNIISQESIDSLVNNQLKSIKSLSFLGSDENAYDYLMSNINGTENKLRDKTGFETIKENLGQVLKALEYAETNQGSLWIEGNDEYSSDSFYFYSPTKISIDAFASNIDTNNTEVETDDKYGLRFTNTTSFNKKGYYLVFLKVVPNGISGADYWQIYAFQYTSSSVDIKIETVDGEVIAGGKYTNKDVTISWKQPGVFDREIKGYYYSANENASREQLLATTKKELTVYETNVNGVKYYTADLGGVQDGTFEKFLIRLESEGESATHKIFTIDRQDISGVQPYLVSEMHSGNSVFYSFATDISDNIVPIRNSITDSYATIYWNDKASGATVSASYSFTPFVQSSTQVGAETGANGKKWLSTNYKLGSTIEGSSLNKTSLDNYNIGSDCILFNQGIYIIHIKDDAGNECYYTFVIDRTENYFEIAGNYITNASVIFGDNVHYEIGDFKVFELSTENDDLASFIQNASANNLSAFKNNLYYSANDGNKNIITNYFQSSKGKYYFTVKNTKVVGFDTENVKDPQIGGLAGDLEYFVQGEASYIRKLYVVSENHSAINMMSESHPEYNSTVRNNAYVSVEINKDNAKGMVYYSSSKIDSVPTDGNNGDSVKRLYAGSDTYENGVEISGLKKAQATSASHVAFVWNMGTGKYEVSKVYYTFYSLKPNQVNPEEKFRYYFYGSGEQYSIYDNGWVDQNYSLGDGRALISFNGDFESRAGLYVVTREYRDYENSDSDYFGDDDGKKTYYFIVDRNKVIDLSQGIGENIKLSLMEAETEFNDFSIGGTEKGVISYPSDEIVDQRYDIYLSTTKLPVTLNIPTGKYMAELDGTIYSSADYYSGRLNVEVYFYDIYSQINKNKAVYKIYSSKEEEIAGLFHSVDIYEYLSKVNVELRDKLTESDENGTWLFLSGEYIVHVTDNVGSELGKFIGFRIVGKDDVGPQIQSNTGFNGDEDSMSKIEVKSDGSFTYYATVSQEYLEVVLPKYDTAVYERAQVDQKYIVIEQYDNEKPAGDYYVNHPYVPKNGINLEDKNSEIVSINQDGSISLWLDTKLRDSNGEIDVANLNKSLKYKITVRYKIGKDDDFEKYQNCYVYYDSEGKLVRFYEATYTIIIDREAPKENVEALNSSDALVQEYNAIFGTESMIGNGVHETYSNLYFTKQYVKYYQENKLDKSYIYSYQVDENTAFIASDVEKVYYKRISVSGLSELASYNLTLPLIDESRYDGIKNAGSFEGYVGLGLEPNNYYEIVEQDAAGNTTQYVIHYSPSSAEISLPVTITQTIDGQDVAGYISFEGFTANNNSNETLDLINIYDLTATANTNSIVENSSFIKIELQRVGDEEDVLQILTTATTNFEKLNAKVVEALKAEKYGNFNLVITARKVYSSSSAENMLVGKININMYDSASLEALKIARLYKDENEQYYRNTENKVVIKLDGANVFDPEKNLWYFATEITIKYYDTTTQQTIEKTYLGSIGDNGDVEYYEDIDVQKVNRQGMIVCSENTTYYLTMSHVLGGEPQKDRFNISIDAFDKISFESPQGDGSFGNYYFLGNEGTTSIYYSYTSALIEFDTTVYTAKIFFKESGRYTGLGKENIDYVKGTNGTYGTILINAFYENGGKLVEAQVVLYDASNINDEEKSYFVTIDTRLENVVLKDFDTGEVSDKIKIYHNSDYKDESIRGGVTTGRLTLNWGIVEENDYFDYEYRIYELLDDNTYRKGDDGLDGTDLSKKTILEITTAKDSKGIYEFEIKIFGKDGKYLGNRIYAFEVKAASSNLYEVRYVYDKTADPFEKANSQFTVEELLTLRDVIVGEFPNINTSVSLPLYVANQELEVNVLSSSKLIGKNEKVIHTSANYTFKICEIYKTGTFNIYIGILEVAEKTNLLKNISIIKSSDSVSTVQQITDSTSFTIPGLVDDSIRIQADIDNIIDVLLKKNTLKIEVYYNNVLMKEEDFKVSEIDTTKAIYEIKGNGQYSFVFKDLAGNVHEFENDIDKNNPETIDMLEVYVLREVVVMVNDGVAIENAFYNGDVTVSIYASRKYVTGSMSIVAYKNGEIYAPKGSNPYIFSDYGTYRVEISARYNDGTNEYTLENVVSFTIINIKEARKSIDLTSLNGSKITKVLNTYGEDKTVEFLAMLNETGGGMNISYENVIKYADALNVTAGKITFTITYNVEDDYPPRQVDFSFTLNNENPTIECSLEKGDSTTKNFKIYFNAAIIYEQIGEAYVYINDKQVAHINENSSNSEVVITTSFDNDGDGDYYIKLVGTSGVVWDSYKVTIKEPLNFWAIVVIIVVVAVVATVTITIIVLRRKMRIR